MATTKLAKLVLILSIGLPEANLENVEPCKVLQQKSYLRHLGYDHGMTCDDREYVHLRYLQRICKMPRKLLCVTECRNDWILSSNCSGDKVSIYLKINIWWRKERRPFYDMFKTLARLCPANTTTQGTFCYVFVAYGM